MSASRIGGEGLSPADGEAAVRPSGSYETTIRGPFSPSRWLLLGSLIVLVCLAAVPGVHWGRYMHLARIVEQSGGQVVTVDRTPVVLTQTLGLAQVWPEVVEVHCGDAPEADAILKLVRGFPAIHTLVIAGPRCSPAALRETVDALPELIVLMCIDTPQITEPWRTQLLTDRPHLNLQVYGPAVLGVKGTSPRGGGDFMVYFVQPGSAADRAGVRSGDIISKLGGRPIRSFSDLTWMVAQHAPGDMITVTVVRRSSAPVELVAQLGKR